MDNLADKYCEGWCLESGKPGVFNDCTGCEIQQHIEALKEGIERIRTASEFYAQDGVSSDLVRYAHESTKRLCDELLSDNGESGE